MNTAVILTARKERTSDIPYPLLPFSDNQCLIDRTLSLLREVGISKILMIVGYRSELFESYRGSDVVLIKTSNYEFTGSMASLAAASDVIDDDFILVEGDTFFEKIVLDSLITGLSVGLATVTVSAENAESDATFTVNVVDPVLPSLVVDPSVISVNFDDELKVKVTLDGKDVTEDVSYTSDDDSIAIVDKGIIKGLKIGNTNVTASLEGANSAVFTVNVVDSAVPSLVVDRYARNVHPAL